MYKKTVEKRLYLTVVWKVGNSFVSFFSFFCTTKKNCDNEDFYPCVAAFDILSAKIFQRKSFIENPFN